MNGRSHTGEASAPPVLVVMGVSGCGKSTVAAQLAQELGIEFLEGDAWHAPSSVAKMASGLPLNDADRADWLALLADKLAGAVRERRGVVLACSALKRSYRDQLRAGAPGLLFVHLRGERSVLAERTAGRSGHYMPPSLLESQLATLEPPKADENALTFDIALTPEAIVHEVCAVLSGISPSSPDT
ncbi:MAG: gluconokinase [Burkholderiaceae bacterium]